MWRTVKLGDVVSYAKSNAQGSSLPYVGMENIASETMELVGEICIPESTSTTFEFDESHVLFGRLRPYLKKVLVPGFRGQCSTEIFCLKPSRELSREYLAYWLLEPTVSKKIDATSTGARMPRANMNKLLEFEFVLPPLTEQKRIVAKLDAAFAEIDAAIKLVEAKGAEVDNLRASLISSLLTGEEMTASTLGETCRMYQPKTISTKDMVANGDYVVFGANGIIGKYDKYNHEHEQLLVTCRGATCGSVNISQPKSWITGNAMVIQPDLAKVSVRYMEYLFRGGIDLSKAITGSAQPQITRKSLEPIKFSYPSLKEQEHIVETLDVASQELNVSMKHTKSILANYNALKSAILAQELQPLQSEAA